MSTYAQFCKNLNLHAWFNNKLYPDILIKTWLIKLHLIVSWPSNLKSDDLRKALLF